jgi:hypothetical protein
MMKPEGHASYGVLVRFEGDHLNLEEIDLRFGVKGDVRGRKGEARFDRPDSWRFPTNLWGWTVSAGDDVPFEQQLQLALDTLERERDYVLSLVRRGKGEVFLSYFNTRGMGGTELSADTLHRLGRLGLSMNLHLSPPTDEDDA